MIYCVQNKAEDTVVTIRTRFAPSPTGYLHVGGARTALYCWLYAQNKQGTFILRIEDTDLERSTKEAKDAILESMAWLGLSYDEGPIYQTDRFVRYKEVADQLLQHGKAYRCYCSKERLEQVREDLTAAKQKPRYDGHCRNSEQGDPSQPHVIRFKNPETGSVVFNDAVRGLVEVSNDEIDDLIIVRSDGAPTYNFSVVVDDSDMQIDIVIRGEDHISNTPRQINILQALGAKIPQYAHIPMILGDDGKRLSKRHGAVSVMQFRDDGYLPHALLNYLVRLGWSHGDQEIFSIEEMIASFDLQHISKSPAAFNTEKLNWLNQHYMKTLPAAEVAESLRWQLQQLGIDPATGPALDLVVKAQCERVKTTKEMAERSKFFFVDAIELDPAAAAKHLTTVVRPALQMLERRFAEQIDWQAPALHNTIVQVAEQCNLGMGKVAQPLRVAVTGNTVSPSIDVTLELIGQDRTIQRIQQALVFISTGG